MRQPGRLHITWADDDTLQDRVRRRHADAACSSSRPRRSAPSGEPTWQGFSRAEWQRPPGGNQNPVRAQIGNSTGPIAPGGGGRGQRGGPPPSGSLTEGGALKVVTSGFRDGYLRKNGVPYSETATITEYIHRLPEGANGDAWLHVLTIVEDPSLLERRVLHEHALQARGERQQVEPHRVPHGTTAAPAALVAPHHPRRRSGAPLPQFL